MTETRIDHDARCKHPAPQLSRAWNGQPEIYCPGCGRVAPLPKEDKQ